MTEMLLQQIVNKLDIIILILLCRWFWGLAKSWKNKLRMK